jgi:hypothetical protein
MTTTTERCVRCQAPLAAGKVDPKAVAREGHNPRCTRVPAAPPAERPRRRGLFHS